MATETFLCGEAPTADACDPLDDGGGDEVVEMGRASGGTAEHSCGGGPIKLEVEGEQPIQARTGACGSPSQTATPPPG